MFAPGSSEIVIGRSLAGRFEGAALGKSMTFGEREWQIVGVVDHGGTAHDSEIRLGGRGWTQHWRAIRSCQSSVP
jgi:putative ABC transport system permease protein